MQHKKIVLVVIIISHIFYVVSSFICMVAFFGNGNEFYADKLGGIFEIFGLLLQTGTIYWFFDYSRKQMGGVDIGGYVPAPIQYQFEG